MSIGSVAMYFSTGEASAGSLPWRQQCRRFTVYDIQLATRNFSESLVIGHGGFGKVYKGTIFNGVAGSMVVAIKRLDPNSNQGAVEFWAEVEMLSKLRHCNLVSLIGYCNEGQEMILVYEYIPRGSLEDHLHKLHTPLSWVEKLKICIGAARGLDYLHTGTGVNHGVIHRDVKSSNILLDENLAARVSDFGLSKIGPKNQPSMYVNTAVKGTFGYLDPDYYSTGRLTRKADVYAFGVILFEVLCAKRAVDRSLDVEQWNLAKWAQDSIKGGRLKQIVDPGLRVEILPKCLKEFARLAEHCLHLHPSQRPTMAEVVVSLELILDLQLKASKSMQPASVTIFGLKVPMFLTSPKGASPGKVESATVPPTPQSPQHEANILQSADLKPFSINVLKTDTRNFQSDSKVTCSPAPLTPQTPRSEAEIWQSANLKPFSFDVLKTATKNFCPDCVLGEEGFGCVYKGRIDEQSLTAANPGSGSGTVVAVKRLSQVGVQGHQEWLSEITYLGTLKHPNLARLIGYCLEDNQRLLVYEFMRKGSLERHLFKRGIRPLPWSLRIKVALGAAKGLAYLHSPEAKVTHRNFKSSKILIDSNYNAKLSDFGMAKDRPANGESYHFTSVTGINVDAGDAAPDYMATDYQTSSRDIYDFGVVLLEILTGRRRINRNRPAGEQVLVEFAKPYLTDQQKILHIIDPRMDGKYSSSVAMGASILAMKCLAEDPELRPTAEEVVKVMEQLQELQKESS